MQAKMKIKQSNAAAHAADVDGGADDEPAVLDTEPKEDTTEGTTQDPNEHDDGSQDFDINAFFSRIPGSTS